MNKLTTPGKLISTATSATTSATYFSPIFRSLAVFDPGLSFLSQLIPGLQPHIDFLVLNHEENAIEQITRFLNHSPQNFQAIHLIGHGSSGMIQLGKTRLNALTLEYYQSNFQQWQVKEILIYGCNTARNSAVFLKRLHQLTGANIAASSTPIGHAELGGNWELDVQIGDVQTRNISPEIAFTPETQATYSGIFATFTVGSLSDDPGAIRDSLTLRDAITAANNSPGPDDIEFALDPPILGDTLSIQLTSPLPTITDTVTIDGLSQAESPETPGTRIELDGSLAGLANGLVIDAPGTTIEGLVINRFALDGIVVNTSGNTIQNTLIGTDISGNLPLGNGQNGIRLGAAASNNTIQDNVISGNAQAGISINLGSSNLIQDNIIGADAAGAGNALLRNLGEGILILNGSENIIGGDTPEQGNLIFGNDGNGISIQGSPELPATANQILNNDIQSHGRNGVELIGASGNAVSGNIIFSNVEDGIVVNNSPGNLISGNELISNLENGLLITGASATGNTVQANQINSQANGAGVLINQNASDNLIGRPAENGIDLGNTITDNAQGVVIVGASSVNNALRNNSISDNVALGIDLNGDGRTNNDSGDIDLGANALQNFPVLSAPAIFSPDLATREIRVEGSLNSTPNRPFTIQVFLNLAEEQQFIGEIQTQTNSSGNAQFNQILDLPDGITAADLEVATVVATTIDATGNTSEFSNSINTAPGGIGLPLVDVTAAIDSTGEGLNPGQIQIDLDAPVPPSGLVLNYNLSGSTAINQQDYQLTAGQNVTALNGTTIALQPGQLTATLNIAAIDDQLVEPDETVQFNLAAGASYQLGTASATVTLTDNDTPGFAISPNTLTTSEQNNGTANFTVSLTAQPTSPVTFSLETSDPSEGTITPTELTIPPNQWNTPQTVTVTGINDFIDDGDIDYQVTVGVTVETADPNFQAITPSVVNVTNLDDDAAAVIVQPSQGLVTTEAGTTDTFEVFLRTQPQNDVVVNLRSSNEQEGQVVPEALTFTALDWNVPKVVTVEGVNDEIADGDRSYRVITSLTTDDPVYQNLDPQDVTSIQNLDDDVASIEVSPINGLTTSEAGGTAAFEVVLTSEPEAEVTFNLSSSNPSEGRVSQSTLTFTPEDWNIAQTVIITGVDDAVADGDRGYTIILDPAQSTDSSGYDGFDPPDVTVINADDTDTPGIIVSPTEGLVTSESGSSLDTFTVVLRSEPTAPVTIQLASSNPQEGRPLEEALVFTAENWDIPQTVSVAGEDDDRDDGPQFYSIVTTVDTQASGYINIDPADVQVRNRDDDQAAVRITPTTGLVTSEAGGEATFEIVLDTEPTAQVTINLSVREIELAEDGTDPGISDEGTLSTTQVTFTPGNWSIPQAVTITGADDLIADGNIPYRIRTESALSPDPDYNGLELPDITVVNTDNETPGITVSPIDGLVTTETGDTDTFAVVLNTQPIANVSLDLNSDNPAEGIALSQSLTFTPDNWLIPQTVTVQGVSDNTVDEDIAYRIVTEAANSSDANYAGLNPDDIQAVNLNTDQPQVVLTVSDNTAAEATTDSVTVTATTSAPVEGEQTVNLVVLGDEISPIDYALSTAQIVIPDGETTGSLTFTAIDDARQEPDEVATLSLIDPSEGIVLGSTTTADITILDNDLAPTVEFVEAIYSVDEDAAGSTVEVSFSRTGDTANPSTVNVQLAGLTATAGEDFDATTLAVEFAPNASFQVINIPIVQDDLAENTETFSLTLVTTGDGTELGTQNTAAVEIIDDDLATLEFDVSSVSVSESGNTGSYEVVLTSQPTDAVTVDFVGEAGQLEPIPPITFTPANWDQPQTVTIRAIDDNQIEGAQSLSILPSLTSEDSRYSDLAELLSITVNVADNDQADVFVTPTSLSLIEGETANYDVVLTRPPVENVTLFASLSSGQLELIANSVTFTPTNWDQPQSITISAVEDDVVEPEEQTVQIAHTISTSDPNYSTLPIIPSVEAVVIDNDVDAEVLLTPITPLIGESLATSELGTVGIYTLELSNIPTASVTIDLDTDNQQLDLSTEVITFDESNWNIPQMVTVAAVDDLLLEGQHSRAINHQVSSSDNNFDSIDVRNVLTEAIATNFTANIIDNEVATVEITQTNGVTQVSEAGATDTYEIVLSDQPTSAVQISLSPDSQLDVGNGQEQPSELVFTPENWNIPQTVTVTAVDDSDIEAEIHTSTINHAVSSTDPNYTVDTPIQIDGIPQANLTVAIVDNDDPLPPGTPQLNLIQPVRRTDVLEGFGEDVYKLVLNSTPTAAVTIQINAGDQLNTNVSSVTFTPENWDLPQTIVVTAVDDEIAEGEQTASLVHQITSDDLRYDQLTDLAFDVTVSDNDDPDPNGPINAATETVLSLGDQDDVVNGSDFGDVFFGNLGNDYVTGNAGEDFLLGQAGADGLDGSTGNDLLIGGQGSDQMAGGPGEDLIFGDRDSDRLRGGEGNDQLFGNFGDDRLQGDIGGDILAGGRGNDAFVIGAGTGGSTPETADRILDFADTQDQFDLLDGLTFEQLEISSGNGGALIRIQATGEYLALVENIDPANLTAQDFV